MKNSTENDNQRQQQSINDEEEKSQTPSQVMAHMTILNDEETENIQKEEKYANDSVKVKKEHKSSPSFEKDSSNEKSSNYSPELKQKSNDSTKPKKYKKYEDIKNAHKPPIEDTNKRKRNFDHQSKPNNKERDNLEPVVKTEHITTRYIVSKDKQEKQETKNNYATIEMLQKDKNNIIIKKLIQNEMCIQYKDADSIIE